MMAFRKLRFRFVDEKSEELSKRNIKRAEVYEKQKIGNQEVDEIHVVGYCEEIDRFYCLYVNLPHYSAEFRNKFVKTLSLNAPGLINTFLERICRETALKRIPLSEFVD